ncbi:hypothetical protein PHSC3_000909 [Chlamydiales bacterium STE3]|nr:hypothetical protein PHSC3_000909 [Chlamydiales bacterium STE3]
MSRLQKIALFFLPLFVSLSSLSFATIDLPEIETQAFHGVPDFIFIPPSKVVIHEGELYAVIDNSLAKIQELHLQNDGQYSVRIYGTCPNGHPYEREGGCYGRNCPFSESP